MSKNEFYLQHIQNYIDGTSSIQDMEIEDHILECIFVFRPELRPKPKLLFSDIWNHDQTSKKDTQKKDTQKKDIEDYDKKELYGEENITLIMDNSHITPKLQIDDILSLVQEGPLFASKEGVETSKNSFVEEEQSGDIIDFSSLKQQSLQKETISKQENVSKQSSITKKQKFSWGIWTSIAVAASVTLIVLPTNIWKQQEDIQTTPSFSRGNSIPSQESKQIEYPEKYRKEGDKINSKTLKGFGGDAESEEQTDEERTIETTQFHEQPKQEHKTKTSNPNDETSMSDETIISSKPSKSIQQSQKSKKRSMPISQSRANLPQKISSDQEEQDETRAFENSEYDEDIVIDAQRVVSMEPQPQTVISTEQQAFETRKVAEEIIEGATEEIADETSMFVSKNSIPASDAFEEERVERKQEVFSRSRLKRDISKEATPPSSAELDNLELKSEDLELKSEDPSLYFNMRIQIQDASGQIELNVSELFFEHVDGRIFPYKDVNQNWVFSVPPNLSGVFVCKGVKSDILFVKNQYVCLWTPQKLICTEP